MRSAQVRLEDVAEAIEGIQAALAGLAFDDFVQSWPLQRAVERGLEIISEASRGISEVSKAAHPSVPWNDIAGIGNILRHEYHRVEPLIIWNITVEHLPVLATAVAELLGAQH